MSCVLFVCAQEMWNMDRCMAYAVDNAYDVARARLSAASAQAEKEQALAAFFPSISASTSAQLSWGRNIDPETNTYNNVTNFSNGYGVYASIMVFDGGQTINRWKMALTEKKRSQNNIDNVRDERAIATMIAYIDVVYYRGASEIASEKEMQSQWALRLTERQEELGIKGMPDLAQARAAHADDSYNCVRQQNLYDQALLALRTGMNFPVGEALELDTISLTCAPAAELDNADEIFSHAVDYNPKAIEAEMNVKSMRYNFRMAKGAMFPSISLNGGISTSYYKTLTGMYGAPAFSRQFRDNLGEYISASLSIPLFDNLGRSSAVKRARYALQNAEYDRDEKLRRLRDDIAAAVMDRDGYAMEILSLEAKTEAEGMAYSLNKRRYEEGLLSYIDLQLSANSYYASRLELLKKRMLYVLKKRLVDYYKGKPLF